MKRYKDLNTLSSILGVSIAAVASAFASEWLKGKQVPTWIRLILAVAIIVLLSQAFRIFLERFLGEVRWVRRLYLGDQFIEGTWFAVSKQDGKDCSLAIISVRAQGTSIRIGGENHTLAGESQGPFWSQTLVIDWPVVSYTYGAQRSGRSSPLGTGFCQWFIEENSPSVPTRYLGVWVDHFDNKSYDVEGWKIADLETLKKLSEAKTRQSVLKQLYVDSRQGHQLNVPSEESSVSE